MAPNADPRPVSLEARSAYERGIEFEGRGEADAAIRSFERAIEHSPEFIDAHRRYQNLLLLRQRRGQLIAEYRARLREAPGSAPRRYLLARLWSDAQRQLSGFEDALAADPHLFFGHVGRGYASLEIGDAAGAAAAFARAIELEPGRPEGYAGRLRAISGEPTQIEESERLAHRLLAIDPLDAAAHRTLALRAVAAGEPAAAIDRLADVTVSSGNAELATLLHDLLVRVGTAAQIDALRARIGGITVESEGGEWLRLRAWLDERAGDPAAALFTLKGALPQHHRSESLQAAEARLNLRTGRLREWISEVFRRRHDVGFSLEDGGRAAAELRAVRDRLPGDHGVPHGSDAELLIDRLLRHGLVEGAIALARRSLDRDPTAAGVRALLDEAIRHRRFVGELNAYFRRVYRGEVAHSFDETLRDLRAISREVLGENVIDPIVERSFFPIGRFLDPDPRNGGGLVRYFDRFGTFFLVGQRTLSPPEAYALARIADARIDVDGEPIYRVVGESLLIPSLAESRGAEIAGFAFETFIVLNVDRVRSSASLARELGRSSREERDSLLTDPLLAVEEATPLSDLGEPLSLAARATERAFDAYVAAGGDPDRYESILLDAVEAHERAHIRDARRFLPLFANWLEKLRILSRNGFRPSSVEAWLEERAQLVALRDAQSPTAVLASTAILLPDRDIAPPHSTGYHELVKKLVDEVIAHPELYPEINRRYTVLPQLDRIGDDRLRRAARRLLDDME